MKSSATISLVLSALALPGAHAAVTLVQPFPTSIPSVSIPGFSVPSGFSLPSGFSIPTPSIPSQSIPGLQSLSSPTITSHSLPTSSVSFTAFLTYSVGGVASADGATTYFIEEIQGINGATKTFTQAIVQGATVWRNDVLHETCSLDGKGGAVCTQGVGEFTTAFTGTAVPIFTVGAGAAGAGGGGNGGSGAPNGAGGGSNGGGANSSAAKVNVGWMLAGTVTAVVAGMSLVL